MSAGTVPAEEAAAVSPWTVLAWVSAVSGPLAYAVGRFVTETFYGRFHVLPGEVGLGYGALVAPALVVMVVTAVAGAVVIAAGRALVVAGAALTLAGALVKLVDLDLRGILIIAAGLLVLGVLALIGTFAGSYGRAAWLALLTALALAVGGFAVHDASRAADAAAQGRAVQRSYLGLPFTAIRATPVRLTGVDGPPELPRQRCLLLLGSSAGVAVLLDGTTVWRVPTDAAMTGSGCR